MPHTNRSKSLLLEGLQCPRHLWLLLSAQGEREGQAESSRMMLGRMVEQVAQQRCPHEIRIPSGGLAAAARHTQPELASSTSAPALVEAASTHGIGGSWAEILLRAGAGILDPLEVEISTSQQLGLLFASKGQVEKL